MNVHVCVCMYVCAYVHICILGKVVHHSVEQDFSERRQCVTLQRAGSRQMKAESP